MSTPERGFSLVELTVVMVTIGILAGIGLPAFQVMTRRGYNLAAHSDYRNLKLAVHAAVADPSSPNRFVFRRIRGPRTLASPLQGATISENVEISVLRDTRLRAGRAPTTVTQIIARNLKGDTVYQLDEVNGVTVESVVTLP